MSENIWPRDQYTGLGGGAYTGPGGGMYTGPGGGAYTGPGGGMYTGPCDNPYQATFLRGLCLYNILKNTDSKTLLT